ncbi:unnamed protein product, partial [Polarella glacialis]
ASVRREVVDPLLQLAWAFSFAQVRDASFVRDAELVLRRIGRDRDLGAQAKLRLAFPTSLSMNFDCQVDGGADAGAISAHSMETGEAWAQSAKPQNVSLQACLASSGEPVATVTVSLDCTAGGLCLAVSKAAAAAAAKAGLKVALNTRGTTGFKVISGGRILEDASVLASSGFLEAFAPPKAEDDPARALPVVELLRCRAGFVATADDGLVKVWQGDTGECVSAFEASPESLADKMPLVPLPCSRAPSGQREVRLTGSTVAKVHVVATGQVAMSLAGHEGIIRQATFSPDNLRVATANEVVTASADGSACLWNLKDGQCSGKLVGHRWSVNSATFSWDSVLVVTSSDDRTARIWDVVSCNCVRVLEGHRSPVLSACFLE